MPAATNTATLLLGYAEAQPVTLNLAMANRHGLIAGATGTGKTITLKVLAESFSAQGVPVFVADVKGDLSGLALPGTTNPKIEERVAKMSLAPFGFTSFPVTFWDIYGKQGHPVRVTVSEMGPLMLARILELNDNQESLLTIAFTIADDNGLLLLDLKDLKALLQWMNDERKTLEASYGAIASASLNTILRKVIAFESTDGDLLFGEPALNLFDWLKTDAQGQGRIHMLAANQLMQNPKLYATFLLWLLSELFEELPEIGDVEKPRLVLFFDEAHLLFSDMPKALLDKIKQVMLLIRSKGVGVYFITQNPMDIPDDVLGQLGCRIVHGLRVVSPKDTKELKALCDGFPQAPGMDLIEIITNLGIGEAVISTLDTKGIPTPAVATLMAPPKSHIGPVDEASRQQLITRSEFYGLYDQPVDRESAYERLTQRQVKQAQETPKAAAPKTTARKSTRQTPMEAMLTSAMRSIGSQVGRQIMRGLLGSISRR